MSEKRIEYWIDGYNVLHRLRLAEGQELRLRREALVLRCQVLSETCWVVFDAREKPVPFRLRRPTSRLTVQFAQDGLSADETIVDRVVRAPDLRHVVVVTDDRELAARCRFRGAEVRGVDAFAKKLLPVKKPAAKPDRPQRPLSGGEVKDWMDWFGYGDDEPG